MNVKKLIENIEPDEEKKCITKLKTIYKERLNYLLKLEEEKKNE